MDEQPTDEDRRNHPRIKSANLVSYTELDHHEVVKKLGLGATVDLSEGGMKVWSTEPLPVGSTIHFELALQERVLHLTARVRYVQEEDDERYLMGVHFDDLSEVDRSVLEEYLHLQRKSTGGWRVPKE